MATRVKRASPTISPEVTIRLYDPGMTPVLRAGLGGIAASLRAIARLSGGWPDRVPLDVGWATVHSSDVALHWGEAGPAACLPQILAESFTLDTNGQVYLPGAYGDALINHPELVAALQAALRRSFLAHPKFVTGATRHTRTFEIDEQQYSYEAESLTGYVHQRQAPELTRAFEADAHLKLASWAYPGAAQRHIAFSNTKAAYSPAQALSAVFALVGCVVYTAPRAEVVVVPDPADLVAFGEVRVGLTPKRYEEVHVAGAGDAVLAVNAALRADNLRRYGRAVADASALLIGQVAWDQQRRVRVGTVDGGTFDDHTLDLYYKVVSTLPTVLRRRAPAAGGRANSRRRPKRTRPVSVRGGGAATGDAFVTVSTLRGFVTENVARRRPWYQDFATATDGSNPSRWIHYYRNDERRNRGALYPQDREAIKAMVEHLDEAERALVESVHDALRRRFGQIAEESKTNPVAMRNRWDGERERWRLAFAGAKTQEQIRAALADLWSRGGGNAPLRRHWTTVLPLLRTERWRAARDLALVALASYSGREREEVDTERDKATAEDIGT